MSLDDQVVSEDATRTETTKLEYRMCAGIVVFPKHGRTTELVLIAPHKYALQGMPGEPSWCNECYPNYLKCKRAGITSPS